ncbi:MAG: methyltransferase, FxLD system [Pseudonocardiales bacterium]
MTEPTTGWRQLNLTCDNWQAAEHMARTQLRPLLTDAEDTGIITAWWFVRKGDTWRVRLRPATPAIIDQITTALLGQETVRTWSETIYEPESHAFGGPTGMDIAHDLFHADCRQLLDRAVLTQHLLFLFNRHGISAHDQYVLATAAGRIVFGPVSTIPDATATTTSGTDLPTLGAVTTANTDTTARAGQLRAALADYIKSWEAFRTPQVEAAFRTVPRHLFLPGIDLDVAYGPQQIVTRRAAEGTSVSSASSPKLVANMLEQLAVQPGLRVLEIGAATGINAALLAELVGPTGEVVTIELDDDLAAGAAKSLGTAGYPQVKVICGDGALGHPDHAPYQRIIVTAEAWDLVPAWWDQLTVGGRLVVPLRLHGSGLTRALGFTRHQPDQMVSTSAFVCGFVPLRGSAQHTDHHVRLAEDVVLKLDTADLPDHAALAHTLTHPPQQHWTGIHVRHDEPAEHLDLWLATTTGNFARMSVGAHARTNGLADPARRWAGAALYDGGTLAYLAARELNDDTNELGVIVHGPDHAKLTAHTTDLLHQWDHQRPSQPTITAHRAEHPTDPSSTGARILRPHTLITIAW